MDAEKFDAEADGGVEDEIPADDLAVAVFFGAHAVEDGEDEQVGERFVELDGV